MSFPIFISKNDIELTTQVLKVCIDKIKGTYTETKLTPSLNRVILQLDSIKEAVKE